MSRKLTLLLSLAALGSFREAGAQGKESFDGFKLVDKSGSIRKPDAYRDLYPMLGSWTILDPKGNQMHYTYASPGTAAYYRRNKKFADGTVLVKEILDTDHGQMTTGDRPLGYGYQSVVCHDQRRKGTLCHQPIVG
jgi:hypothetical protein